MTAMLVIFVPALVLLAGLVLDGGLALAGKVRALDEAQEAARAGAQQIDLATLRRTGTVTLLPTQAAAAARAYLAATGDTGAVVVNGLSVSVNVTHVQHTQILNLAGIRALTVTSTATATAEPGVTGPSR